MNSNIQYYFRLTDPTVVSNTGRYLTLGLMVVALLVDGGGIVGGLVGGAGGCVCGVDVCAVAVVTLKNAVSGTSLTDA